MFGTILQKLMAERGLSAYDVADAMNVAPSTVYDWMNGKAAPRPKKRLELSQFLEVPVSVFDVSGHTTTTISSIEINTPRADELVLLSQYRELTAENKIKTIEYMEFLLSRQAVNKKTAN